MKVVSGGSGDGDGGGGGDACRLPCGKEVPPIASATYAGGGRITLFGVLMYDCGLWSGSMVLVRNEPFGGPNPVAEVWGKEVGSTAGGGGWS